jgi:hypothetical protein
MGQVVTLVHPEGTFEVPAKLFVNKCERFADDARLAALPYHLKSRVSLSDLREFVSALEGTAVKVTNNNFKGLLQLCAEFHFRDLYVQLSEFQASAGFREHAAVLSAIKERVLSIEEEMHHRKREIASLPRELLRLQEWFEQRIRAEAELASRRANEVEMHVCEVRREVEVIRNGLREVRVLAERAQMKAASTEARFTTELSALRTAIVGEIRSQGEAFRNALNGVRVFAEQAQKSAASTEGQFWRLARLEADILALQAMPVVPIARAPAPASAPFSVLPPAFGWHSAIVPGFPKLFEEFRTKAFTLLWRGSRDGFGAPEFHRLCDGHASTLTVILDTDGNMFGGFTPLAWESRRPKAIWDDTNCQKADPNLKTFLFTLTNPHNFPARRFPLKAEQMHMAIYCTHDRGPDFCDISIWDDSRAKTVGCTSNFGRRYTNDTGIDSKTFFTGGEYFRVKEIEVFEIRN